MNRLENVRIESLAYTGDAIAHLDGGKTVFVTGGAPDDLALIRIDEDRERFARASIVELLEPSPERVETACPYQGTCGGCGLQHISYEGQLKAKRRFVVDALARIGAIGDAEKIVGETVHASSAWNYRNKLELEPIEGGRRLLLGFHGKHSSEIIPVESCLLLPKGFEDLPKRLAGALGYALNDSPSPLRRVGIRISRLTGAVELALWTQPGAFNRAFVAKVLGDGLKTTSLVRVLAKGPLAKRDVKGVEVLSGKGYWEEDLAGFRFKVSAPSFFQVNTDAAELLVGQVLSAFDFEGRRVADLCCGAGTFSLPLAELTDNLVAVEIEGSGVRDLRRNLMDNGLDAEVVGGGIEYFLPEAGTLDCAVVDPPRSGLGEIARKALVAGTIKDLVYVSCDPSTLARDVKELTAGGFSLLRATPVDLFPQTYHVETVAVLSRS